MDKKTNNNYKLTLEVLGTKWRSEGSSVESALKKLKVNYQDIMGKGILTIRKGSKKMEYLTNAIKLRRLLSNKIIRLKQARNLENLLALGKKTNFPQ